MDHDRGDIVIEKLRHEATVFHVALFGSLPTRALIDRYCQASTSLALDGSASLDLDTIMHHRLDVEAIECATRKHKTILTKKMYTIVYLAECSPEHFDFFYAQDRQIFLGYGKLVWHTLRTIYKFIKGKYLVWRFALVRS